MGGASATPLANAARNPPNGRSAQLCACHETMRCVPGGVRASAAPLPGSMQVSIDRAAYGLRCAWTAVARPPLSLQPAPEWPATITRSGSMAATPSSSLVVRATNRSRSKPGQLVTATVTAAGMIEPGPATTTGGMSPRSIISATMRRTSPSLPPPIQRCSMSSVLRPCRNTKSGRGLSGSALALACTKARPT